MDSSPPPPPPAGGTTTCPLCSNPLPWIRSVKRKVDDDDLAAALADGAPRDGDFDSTVARVGPGAEVLALREAAATAAALAAELEEERAAASSAASEAMAMIVRLQREKAEAMMEARQCRRFADERMALDAELAARREEELRELSYRLEFYRRRLEEFGVPLPDFDNYPRLKCSSNIEESDIAGDASKGKGFLGDRCHYEHPDVEDDMIMPLRDLERRILSLEQSPRMNADKEALNERDAFAAYDNECATEEDYEGDGDDGSARVYTIDAVHKSRLLPNIKVSEEGKYGEAEPDIKRLYARLEALEADRESMSQALVAVRTEKAQLLLLKEIAQQLAKEKGASSGAGGGSEGLPIKGLSPLPSKLSATGMLPIAKTAPPVVSPPLPQQTPVPAPKNRGFRLFKWAFTAFRAQRASNSRYSFGVSNENAGLLLVLEKAPHVSRRLSSIQD